MGAPEKAEFGLIGLGIMGGAYARNVYSRGFRVAAWTRNEDEIETFNSLLENDRKRRAAAKTGAINCYTDIREFVESLEKPRKVMMLITAGNPVDSMLNTLLPLLDRDDIVVDGGNAWYKNTESRISRCSDAGIRFDVCHGLRFAGMGVSGGERGARKQPCLMFGGNREDYEKLKPILSQDSRDFYVGTGASGHYVKMVHNGVEYALMQTICELYKMMKLANGLDNAQIAEVFKKWDSEDHCYLLRISGMILTRREGEDYLVDKITPRIASNGTGKWTVQDAFDRGVPVPSIGIAVDMRSFSNLTQGTPDASKGGAGPGYPKFETDDLRTALGCTAISIFSQGLHLLTESSKQSNWGLRMETVADIWSRNAIISCNLLKEVAESFRNNSTLLVLHPRERVAAGMNAWKRVAGACLEHGLPAPAISASLQYVQVLLAETVRRSSRAQHCHNLIQAQRDCFGSHCFERVDRPGKHHHNWWEAEHVEGAK